MTIRNRVLNLVTFGAYGELMDRYASLLQGNSALRVVLEGRTKERDALTEVAMTYQKERNEAEESLRKHLDTHNEPEYSNDMATMTLPRTPRLIAYFNRRNNDSTPNDKTQERFLRFHNANPKVYSKLVALALQVKATGKDKYSIWALYQRLRWHIEIETKGEPFKLSNDFTSRYSRLIMQQEPELKGFFTTHALKRAA